MDKLRKDMEKSKGETVVLNTGLKDKRSEGKKMMDEDEDEEEKYDEDEDFETFSEEADATIDEDEDEEVANFRF